MSLEFANRICPNCKNPNYIVFLGDFSKAYKYKCMNCNGYFNDNNFEEGPQQIKKSKEEVLLAIIGKQSYADLEKFKQLEKLNDEYFNGMLDSIRAVEKLFDDDGSLFITVENKEDGGA